MIMQFHSLHSEMKYSRSCCCSWSTHLLVWLKRLYIECTGRGPTTCSSLWACDSNWAKPTEWGSYSIWLPGAQSRYAPVPRHNNTALLSEGPSYPCNGSRWTVLLRILQAWLHWKRPPQQGPWQGAKFLCHWETRIGNVLIWQLVTSCRWRCQSWIVNQMVILPPHESPGCLWIFFLCVCDGAAPHMHCCKVFSLFNSILQGENGITLSGN